MRRSILFALATILSAGLALAGPQETKKKTPLRCTLTNRKIEKCCCEKRGEKLYCTLAKKTIDKCCCESAEDKKQG